MCVCTYLHIDFLFYIKKAGFYHIRLGRNWLVLFVCGRV